MSENNEEAAKILRRLTNEIAEDYPNPTESMPLHECSWAIISTFKGTILANKSGHRFIKHLGEKLGMSNEEIYQEWMRLENE